MDILKNIKVPTGNIFVVKGQKGNLEMLSIGDYGQNINLNQNKILETNFKKAGFETLVFIASNDEDDGLITCGNAILSGSIPRCKYQELI